MSNIPDGSNEALNRQYAEIDAYEATRDKFELWVKENIDIGLELQNLGVLILKGMETHDRELLSMRTLEMLEELKARLEVALGELPDAE